MADTTLKVFKNSFSFKNSIAFGGHVIQLAKEFDFTVKKRKNGAYPQIFAPNHGNDGLQLFNAGNIAATVSISIMKSRIRP